MARAPYLLFRIDDRLLHGQVSLGWGTRLRPKFYLIADDETAHDPLARAMYEDASGDSARVVCAPLEAVASESPELPAPEKTMLLVRSVTAAARLLRAGVPGPVNLGGLHLRPGARARLDILYLTAEDEATLGALLSEGYELFVQDLPTNRARTLTPDLLLPTDEGV